MSDSVKHVARGPYRVITCRRLSGDACGGQVPHSVDRQENKDPVAGQRPAASGT